MWFKNIIVYQYQLPQATPSFHDALREKALKPCPPHTRFTLGWLPTRNDLFCHEVNGSTLFYMGKEERILPRGVIHKLLQEKVQLLEQQQDRSLKRAEKKQLAEDIEFELLPKSFSVIKKLPALLDHKRQRLIINTSSSNQATQLLSLLKNTLSDLQLDPISCPENLARLFSQWIESPDMLPSPFQLASHCTLFSLDNEKKQIQCKGYELPAEEVLSLLATGLATAELSLIWQERIQFTLTQNFVLKKIKCLDYLMDEFSEIKQVDEVAQQEDAALVLLAGELAALLDDLHKALNINMLLNQAEMA